MEYTIETFSLTKVFSDWWGRNKVYAVDDLNLKVRTNEVFGLLGPNGSGKTTTLKMLLGLLHPTQGRALCLGGDATDPKVNSHIGYLPEESYLYRYLTARETLDFYGQLFRIPSKVRKMRTEALLDMVGLKAVANRQVGTFSKGMARRIGLAQALINDPDLLILDEPTTGLDPIGTRQIKDLIIELAKRGKTVLLCSHLLADVEDVCDRIAILYGGRIQAEGHVRDLLQHMDRREILTGRLSDGAVERIKQIVSQEGSGFAVSSPMDKLETFFINIVNKAQEQGAATSGAESKTQISDFLTGKAAEAAPTAAILDELASADVRPAQAPAAEQASVQPVEHVQTGAADEDVLKKLTSVEQPSAPKPVKEQVEETPSSQEQVNKDVLDDLIGRPQPDKPKHGSAED